MLLLGMLFCVGRSAALVAPLPSIQNQARARVGGLHSSPGCNLQLHKSIRRSLFSRPLYSSTEDNAEPYLDDEFDEAEASDNTGDDEYFDRFITDAFNDEENKDDDAATTSKQQEAAAAASSSSSDETKQMMEQQQQQIDQLMKLVQQQQQGRQSPQPSRSQQPLQNPDQQQQKSINVAPLKCMLFIDGTWLYYSINSRKSNRCAIVPKFGRGWQNVRENER